MPDFCLIPAETAPRGASAPTRETCSHGKPPQASRPRRRRRHRRAGLPAAPDARRRNLLKAGLSASLLPVGGSALLAACAGGDDNATTAAPAGGAGATPQGPQTPQAISSFALAVLPDTQFYARYATVAENRQFSRKFGSEPFRAQTQWVADNAAGSTSPSRSTGDVVDQQGKEA